MFCSVCKNPYEGFACPVCLARISRESYLRQQAMFLPFVLNGRLDLKLSKRKRSDLYHIELIEEPTHAYCGEKLEYSPLRERQKYSEELRAKLCPKCVAQFDECVAKLRAAKAAEV